MHLDNTDHMAINNQAECCGSIRGIILKTVHNIFFSIIFAMGFLGGATVNAMNQDETQQVTQPGKKEIPKITFKNLSPPGGWLRPLLSCMRMKVLSDPNSARPVCRK